MTLSSHSEPAVEAGGGPAPASAAWPSSRLRIRVPASSANLGPGFDCFGIALALYNEVVIDVSAPPAVHYAGRDAEVLATQENLVATAMTVAARACGFALPPVAMSLLTSIPTTRGLGSSAAAIVAGLAAASALGGGHLSLADIMQLGSEMEGHGDNIGAAVYGGMVVSVHERDRYQALPVPVGDDLRAVVFVPEKLLSTSAARAVLPKSLSMADAIYNIGRAAMLTVALQQRRYDYLATAMGDRLHQPYRAPLVDGLNELMGVAVGAGAYGACLSGAGPSMLTLADPDQAVVVAAALARAAHEHGLSGEVLQLDICRTGVQVVWEAD